MHPACVYHLSRRAPRLLPGPSDHSLYAPCMLSVPPAPRLVAGLSDLERALARLTAAGSGHGSAREAPHVVLYEDVARKRVQGFAAVLRGLHRIQEAMQLFQGGEADCQVMESLWVPWKMCCCVFPCPLQNAPGGTDGWCASLL